MATLTATQLVKHYHSRAVVDGISLQLNSGEIVGLLGPNGAGKTTCFYMLVGLVTPDQGKISIDQENITYYPMHQRAQLGLSYLPQETSIFRKLSVQQNILAIAQLRRDLNRAQQQQLTQTLMEEFHISHLADVNAMALSGGERRRVEIARALAIKPQFILLDEPFAGIDPISIVDIKRIVTQLSERNIGIFITDHNVNETLDICERAYIVYSGKVIAEGTPKQVLNNPHVRQVYLGESFKTAIGE